jgi:hypothetical protein
MPYMHEGKTVYKKNAKGGKGKKVGTTKGDVKKYLAALYANSPDTKKKSFTKGVGG